MQLAEHSSVDGKGVRRRQRVLVASNHSLVRHGLRLMLSAATSFIVVHDDRPITQVGAALSEHDPDILILDLSTGDYGPEQLKEVIRLCDHRAKLVLICPAGRGSAFATDLMPSSSFVTNCEDAIELINSLRLWAAQLSEPVEPHGVAAGLPVNHGSMPYKDLHITPREREVIELITQGLCSKRIARALNISVTTVRTHRQRLMTKLGLRNSIEVARFAARTFGRGPLTGAPAVAGSSE